LWISIDRFLWQLVGKKFVESCRIVGGHFFSLFSHLLARSEADFFMTSFHTYISRSEFVVCLPLFTHVLTGVRQHSFAILASE
jgi:hypothetical protein